MTTNIEERTCQMCPDGYFLSENKCIEESLFIQSEDNTDQS